EHGERGERHLRPEHLEQRGDDHDTREVTSARHGRPAGRKVGRPPRHRADARKGGRKVREATCCDPRFMTTRTEDIHMATTTETIRNGVDTDQLFGTLDAIKADPSIARFQFRARNRWIDGAHNQSTIRGFYAANQEDTSRAAEF